jgi:hypothetical protein
MSQVKTLSYLAAGLLEAQSLNVSKIGQHLPGAAYVKHKIKRVSRFVTNEGVDLDEVTRALICLLSRPGEKLIVALDWTTIGTYEVLTSGIVTKHRSIPIFWTVIDEHVVRKKDAEFQHLRKLRELVPKEAGPIVLCDAGFDDTSFLEAIGAHFQFVVRAAKNVSVRREGTHEFHKLSDLEIERDRAYDFGIVDFCASYPVRVRLVIVHDRDQEDRWNLLTNVTECDERTVIRLYGRRFEIEESFKDWKAVRSGFQLKGHKMRSPENLARLLIIAVVAYLFLVLAGMLGEKRNLHRRYQANTAKHRVLALWRLGLLILRDHRPRLGRVDIHANHMHTAANWTKEVNRAINLS